MRMTAGHCSSGELVRRRNFALRAVCASLWKTSPSLSLQGRGIITGHEGRRSAVSADTIWPCPLVSPEERLLLKCRGEKFQGAGAPEEPRRYRSRRESVGARHPSVTRAPASW